MSPTKTYAMNVAGKGSALAVAAVTMSESRSRPLFLDDRAKHSPLRHSATFQIASHNAPRVHKINDSGEDWKITKIARHYLLKIKRALCYQHPNVPPLQIHTMTLPCGCTLDNVPNELI